MYLRQQQDDTKCFQRHKETRTTHVRLQHWWIQQEASVSTASGGYLDGDITLAHSCTNAPPWRRNLSGPERSCAPGRPCPFIYSPGEDQPLMDPNTCYWEICSPSVSFSLFLNTGGRLFSPGSESQDVFFIFSGLLTHIEESVLFILDLHALLLLMKQQKNVNTKNLL